MAKAKPKTTRRRRSGASSRNGSAPSTNGNITGDGTLVFDIRGGVHDGQRIEMDALVVKLASEPLERDLPQGGGLMTATPEFAVALDARLKGIGYTSTPSIAVAAWQRASAYVADQQKKTN